jgi:hypothetical protein
MDGAIQHAMKPFARQIEDLILSRARELRAESLAEITD